MPPLSGWKVVVNFAPSAGIKFLLSAALLFLVCFGLTLYVGLQLGGLVQNSLQAPLQDEHTFLGFRAVKISEAGEFIRISHSAEINPGPEKDFLLTAWFRIRRLPKEGKRIILLSKYASAGRVKHGFALALTRQEGDLRFAVFWANRAGKGGWYMFPESGINSRGWFMLALSYINQQFLGLHSCRELGGEKTELKLEGGYKLPPGLRPQSSADLIGGAYNKRAFRGELGPLGIYSKSDLERRLSAVLRELCREPRHVPADFASANVKLWTPDLQRDHSRYAHAIRHVRR